MTSATTHRFGSCEIDEARRALRAHGREIKLQPRVFDVLCYLVRHRDRVVPKDELLDALWPGTVVVDNALQRVVSIARGALDEAGLPDALRTYPRHGYRFCADNDGCGETPDADADAGTEAAHAALDALDWAAACAAYAEADARVPLPAPEVELWGRAAICAGCGAAAVGALERVVAERDAAGDALAAVRAALLLVQIHVDRRQGAIASGLMQRAARWLDGHDTSTERGHHAWMASRIALGNGDVAQALAMADEACRVGRRLPDADVECLGLVYPGHALIAHGRVAEGVVQHEEAAAVVRLGGVRPWVAGWALCGILYTARYRCDWQRAAQFAEVYGAWSRTSRMPAFPGTCQLHRAAVLGVQGELASAADQAREAAASLERVAPWAVGDAHCVLGDILLDGGDVDGAEQAFRQAHASGWEPQPGLARVQLATGRPELALRGLERALDGIDWTMQERRGQLLCLLACAAVAAGQVDRARETLRALAADRQMLATAALEALHCGAQAEVAIADDDLALAARLLRQAVRHWHDVGSPVGEAQARVRLAECLLRDRDAAGAELELHAIDSQLRGAAVAFGARLAALRDGVRAPSATRVR